MAKKSMQNDCIYNHTRVVVLQKTVGKKTNIRGNETILKIGHLAKAIAHGKGIAFAKWSVWVKN